MGRCTLCDINGVLAQRNSLSVVANELSLREAAAVVEEEAEGEIAAWESEGVHYGEQREKEGEGREERAAGRYLWLRGR